MHRVITGDTHTSSEGKPHWFNALKPLGHKYPALRHHIYLLYIFFPLIDNRPSHASGGLQSQRGVHTNPATRRAPHWRANAVQVRGEAPPRPFLRQQTQLVSFEMSVILVAEQSSFTHSLTHSPPPSSFTASGHDSQSGVREAWGVIL